MNKCLCLFLIAILSCSCQQNLRKVRLLKNHKRSQHESYADNVMITTQGHHSTQAGLEILRAGGNLVDAAIAISFAIGVERPQSTGLGGGGFLLIDGPKFKKPKSLDFREMAPRKSSATMYLDKKGNEIKNLSLNGALASGVPGLVDGLMTLHKQYGKLPLAQIMKPAIKLARNGFLIYPHLARSFRVREKVLRKYPASYALFFKDDRPLKVGERLIQEDLAKTLEIIAKLGRAGFYEGFVATAIATEMSKYGGLITKKDLKKYQSKWRDPVTSNYGEYEIFSMAPPSSGGSHIIQLFNILKPMNLSQYGPQHINSIHATASAMELVFIDRARYMGDQDFVKVPVKGITSKAYADLLRAKITMQALKEDEKSMPNAFAYESSETTHFTIMDKEGNTISSTQTTNYLMGSGLVIAGTGIVMNNEMDDFSTKPGALNVFGAVGGKNNLVGPLKRPLSSMSPTIIRKKGKPFFALGTPSGTRILTCVAQVAFNYLEYGLSLYDAVAATRYHHQWQPHVLQIEEPGFHPTVEEALEEKGHGLKKRSLGCKIQAIALEKGKLHGVSDPRGEGLARGF
jgi:gamma-glutamyltranspeptidase/glutathione hydrolase